MVYKIWNFQLSTDALKMKKHTNEIELVQVPVTDKCIPHAFVVFFFLLVFVEALILSK